MAAAGIAALAFAKKKNAGFINKQFPLPKIELPDEFQVAKALFVCRAATEMNDVAWWAYQDEVAKCGL